MNSLMAEQRWLAEVMASAKAREVANKTKDAPMMHNGRSGKVKKENENLPKSVRNAPPELRAAIRRKQNSEVS